MIPARPCGPGEPGFEPGWFCLKPCPPARCRLPCRACPSTPPLPSQQYFGERPFGAPPPYCWLNDNKQNEEMRSVWWCDWFNSLIATDGVAVCSHTQSNAHPLNFEIFNTLCISSSCLFFVSGWRISVRADKTLLMSGLKLLLGLGFALFTELSSAHSRLATLAALQRSTILPRPLWACRLNLVPPVCLV